MSDDAKRAMALVRDAAERLGHDAIDAEHLMLGALGVATGAAHRALAVLGIDAVALRAALEARMLRGNARGPLGQLPFTLAAKRALELAIGHERTPQEHLPAVWRRSWVVVSRAARLRLAVTCFLLGAVVALIVTRRPAAGSVSPDLLGSAVLAVVLVSMVFDHFERRARARAEEGAAARQPRTQLTDLDLLIGAACAGRIASAALRELGVTVDALIAVRDTRFASA